MVAAKNDTVINNDGDCNNNDVIGNDADEDDEDDDEGDDEDDDDGDGNGDNDK